MLTMLHHPGHGVLFRFIVDIAKGMEYLASRHFVRDARPPPQKNPPKKNNVQSTCEVFGCFFVPGIYLYWCLEYSLAAGTLLRTHLLTYRYPPTYFFCPSDPNLLLQKVEFVMNSLRHSYLPKNRFHTHGRCTATSLPGTCWSALPTVASSQISG